MYGTEGKNCPFLCRWLTSALPAIPSPSPGSGLIDGWLGELNIAPLYSAQSPSCFFWQGAVVMVEK